MKKVDEVVNGLQVKKVSVNDFFSKELANFYGDLKINGQPKWYDENTANSIQQEVESLLREGERVRVEVNGKLYELTLGGESGEEARPISLQISTSSADEANRQLSNELKKNGFNPNESFSVTYNGQPTEFSDLGAFTSWFTSQFNNLSPGKSLTFTISQGSTTYEVTITKAKPPKPSTTANLSPVTAQEPIQTASFKDLQEAANWLSDTYGELYPNLDWGALLDTYVDALSSIYGNAKAGKMVLEVVNAWRKRMEKWKAEFNETYLSYDLEEISSLVPDNTVQIDIEFVTGEKFTFIDNKNTAKKGWQAQILKSKSEVRSLLLKKIPFTLRMKIQNSESKTTTEEKKVVYSPSKEWSSYPAWGAQLLFAALDSLVFADALPRYITEELPKGHDLKDKPSPQGWIFPYADFLWEKSLSISAAKGLGERPPLLAFAAAGQALGGVPSRPPFPGFSIIRDSFSVYLIGDWGKLGFDLFSGISRGGLSLEAYRTYVSQVMAGQYGVGLPWVQGPLMGGAVEEAMGPVGLSAYAREAQLKLAYRARVMATTSPPPGMGKEAPLVLSLGWFWATKWVVEYDDQGNPKVVPKWRGEAFGAGLTTPGWENLASSGGTIPPAGAFGYYSTEEDQGGLVAFGSGFWRGYPLFGAWYGWDSQGSFVFIRGLLNLGGLVVFVPGLKIRKEGRDWNRAKVEGVAIPMTFAGQEGEWKLSGFLEVDPETGHLKGYLTLKKEKSTISLQLSVDDQGRQAWTVSYEGGKWFGMAFRDWSDLGLGLGGKVGSKMIGGGLIFRDGKMDGWFGVVKDQQGRYYLLIKNAQGRTEVVSRLTFKGGKVILEGAYLGPTEGKEEEILARLQWAFKEGWRIIGGYGGGATRESIAGVEFPSRLSSIVKPTWALRRTPFDQTREGTGMQVPTPDWYYGWIPAFSDAIDLAKGWFVGLEGNATLKKLYLVYDFKAAKEGKEYFSGYVELEVDEVPVKGVYTHAKDTTGHDIIGLKIGEGDTFFGLGFSRRSTGGATTRTGEVFTGFRAGGATVRLGFGRRFTSRTLYSAGGRPIGEETTRQDFTRALLAFSSGWNVGVTFLPGRKGASKLGLEVSTRSKGWGAAMQLYSSSDEVSFGLTFQGRPKWLQGGSLGVTGILSKSGGKPLTHKITAFFRFYP